MKTYICRHCGNIVSMISDAGVPVVCCGQKMEELVPNTVKVNVGSVDHPMTPEHYIEWVYIETEKGGQCKKINPGEAPSVTFSLNDDKAVAAYAYCSLHGLWKTEIEKKRVCDLKPLDVS